MNAKERERKRKMKNPFQLKMESVKSVKVLIKKIHFFVISFCCWMCVHTYNIYNMFILINLCCDVAGWFTNKKNEKKIFCFFIITVHNIIIIIEIDHNQISFEITAFIRIHMLVYCTTSHMSTYSDLV